MCVTSGTRFALAVLNLENFVDCKNVHLVLKVNIIH